MEDCGMCKKLMFEIFYYLGILSIVAGIVVKLTGWMPFDLKPTRYLLFAGLCALFAIASILCHWCCQEKK